MSKKVKFFLKLFLVIVCLYLFSFVVWKTSKDGYMWYSMANLVLAFFSVVISIVFMMVDINDKSN